MSAALGSHGLLRTLPQQFCLVSVCPVSTLLTGIVSSAHKSWVIAAAFKKHEIKTLVANFSFSFIEFLHQRVNVFHLASLSEQPSCLPTYLSSSAMASVWKEEAIRPVLHWADLGWATSWQGWPPAELRKEWVPQTRGGCLCSTNAFPQLSRLWSFQVRPKARWKQCRHVTIIALDGLSGILSIFWKSLCTQILGFFVLFCFCLYEQPQ